MIMNRTAVLLPLANGIQGIRSVSVPGAAPAELYPKSDNSKK